MPKFELQIDPAPQRQNVTHSQRTRGQEIFCTRYKNSDWEANYVTVSIPALKLWHNERLSGAQIKLLLFIAMHEKRNANDIWLSYRYMNKGTQMSLSTVTAAVNSLLKAGFIEKVGNGFRTRAFSSEAELQAVRSECRKSIQGNSYAETSNTSVPETETNAHRISVQIKEPNKAVRLATPALIREKEGGEEEVTASRSDPSDLRSLPNSDTELPEEEITPEDDDSGQQNIPIPKQQSEEERQAALEQEIHDDALSRLIYSKNTITKTSYYAKIDWISTGFHDKLDIAGHYPLFARTKFLRATNEMYDLSRDYGLKTPIRPNTKSDILKLGEVVANFTHEYVWLPGFRCYFWWVLRNKEDICFNFLSHYFSDWMAADKQAAKFVGFGR